MRVGLVAAVAALFLWRTYTVSAAEPTPTPSNTGTTSTRDPEWYNYLPIIMNPGVSLTTTDNLKDVIIGNLVQDQGYEVHCAAPQWHMSPSLYGEYQKYFEDGNYQGAVLLKSPDTGDPYNVDLNEARIAMMRGDEDTTTTNKISSLEALFGVVNPALPPDETNSSGAIYNLLSLEQQCDIKMKTMAAMKSVCLRHESSSICALNMKIPGTNDFKMGDLLAMLLEAKANFGEDDQFCGAFVAGYKEDVITDRMKLSKADYEKASEALQNYSIDQEHLYRVGFLVISVTQNIDEGEDDVFWYRKMPEDINATLQAPIIVAFKIPDFLTNKSQSISDFRDSSMILRDLYWKPEIIEQMNEDSQKKRQENMQLIANRRDAQEIIKCGGLYPCPKDTPPEILQRAVIDIINGLGNACQETYMPYENAGDIGSPAKVTDERRTMLPPNFPYLIPSKRIANFAWEMEVNRDKPLANGQEMRVRAHLVIPMGTDLRYVEETLKALFQPEPYKEMEENHVMVDYQNKLGSPDYYPITGRQIGFNSSNPTHTFTDYNAGPTECETDPITKIETCKYPERQFGAVIIEAGMEPLRILGAKFGWMVRMIQEEFRQPHLKIKCSRTEDLFLGRCTIPPEGEEEEKFTCDGKAFENIKDMPAADQVPEFAKSTYDSQIEPKITKELIEAYAYAEKETGIPCEVVAGIHWTEGGMNPNQSLFDGGALRGTLKEDAKAAMEHLKSKWKGQFNPDNIPYQDLVAAIGAFNGPGNMNCSSDPSNQPRPTRWRTGNKCPAQFESEDHPHPLGWIDDRHSDMDLIYCLDFVEFKCDTEPTTAALASLRTILDESQAAYNFSDEKKEQLITDAAQYCYANSSICQTLSEGRRYPRYDRPGSLTTAILLHESGSAQ